MRRKTPLLLALISLHVFYGMAQKFRFEFFTTAQGLAGNNTSTPTQDDQGFLWFVNDGKVHRYDGRNFLTCLPPPGSPANAEPFLGLALWQDSLLFLWSEHAAFLYHPKTGNWQNVHRKEPFAENKEMLFWQRLGQNNILINRRKRGIAEADVWHFQNNRLAPVILPRNIATLKASSFYWCDIDASGRTYLAYNDTLFHLDNSGHIILSTPLNNICTGCYNLNFQFEPDGGLILLANWRFFRLDKVNNRFVPHPANRFLQAGKNHLHRFILEKNGGIWAVGQYRNLVYYDAVNDTLYNFQNELKALLPNPNDFKDIYQDNTGIVWVATRLGLLKVRPQVYPFDNYFNGLDQSNNYYSFRGFSEDVAGMIYGVFYEGIAKFDPVRKQALRIYNFSRILSFFDLYQEGNRLWVNGEQLFDPVTGAITDVPGSFHENPVGDNGFFAKDKNGVLWWMAHFQLYRLEKSETGAFHWKLNLELPEKIFNKTDALHAGSHSGKLWSSFKGKLLQYDPVTRAQYWYDPESWGSAVSRILVIEEDPSGKLWLGTDGGLVHFDPLNGTSRRYTVNEGLPDNFICGLLPEGDSCLWLSTNHGLSRFHIGNETFINFYEEDGISSNEFNRKSYFKTRNGRFIFGGMRGVTAFFPDAVMQVFQSKQKGAKMVLSSFEYTDERRDTIFRKTGFAHTPEIRLHHWDWSYTFEYALTDYDNPKEIFYSYKMEGYKESWSAPSKFNFARFNSLPAGEYTFRVKARDGKGLWHSSELAVKLIVFPPWWATGWAYIVYGLVFAVVLYFLRGYEINRQVLKNNLKLEKVEADKLKELDHFKSRLYTNLTHELRTPLTVILGMVGQLREDPQKHLGEAIRLIEANGKNLLQLINQLLDLSKLENKSFQLRLQRSDIVPYLRYMTESFQTYANHKNLSLRFFTTLESLEMDYDPEQIKQVLTNLISNAVKFTPSGGEVSVHVREKIAGPEDSPILEISVSDTGIGISENDLPHIFDRFYQVDGSHTREGEGTGIGLAHTLELVKIMNGEINVESSVGKGSVFKIGLPVTRYAPATNRKGHESRSIAEAPIPNLDASGTPAVLQSGDTARPPTVLIIEDNPDVVVYLKSCLEDFYQLDIAYNGEIGIEKALETIPDLIVSDVMMPGKDGFEVCDTLKNDDRSSHIPIILLTAKADAASKIAGLRRGADAYLTKPFDKEELLVRLETLVQRQKRMAAYFSKILLGGTAPVSKEIEDAILVEDAFMQKLRQTVEENYRDENFALPELCKKIEMSRSQLFRKMQAVSDTSPSDFIRSYRLNKAKTLLETTDLSVYEVAWQVGFKDVAHFSKSYLEIFGISPSSSRRQLNSGTEK